ncbi:MAG: hypothetical protein WA888_12955 [Burkholderiaceae bacterium]
MFQQFGLAVEAWPIAVALRGSIWLYPLVNIAHLLGIAFLIGCIVSLDLRLLGLWPHQPWQSLAIVLRPMAVVGLVLAIGSGLLLFVARAADYTANPLFLVKLGLVVLGIANAIWLGRSDSWRQAISRKLATGSSNVANPGSNRGPIRWPLRLAAGLSLTFWISALVLGRLVGYR